MNDETIPTSRQVLLERFERATEVPLVLLALALVPLICVPLFVDVSPAAERLIETLNWFVWAAFAFEYVVRLSLTDNRWRFVRKQWPDLLIIVLPFLRPLRLVRSAYALRLLHLGRLVAVIAELSQEGRRLLRRNSFQYSLVVACAIVFFGAVLGYAAEAGSEGSMDSFGDALWWSVATITTVGYGDVFPVTAAGRGVAVFLMIAGISLFGVVSANLAAVLLARETAEEEAAEDDLAVQVQMLTAEVRALREEISSRP